MWVTTSLKVNRLFLYYTQCVTAIHNKPRLFAKPLNKAENVMRLMKYLRSWQNINPLITQWIVRNKKPKKAVDAIALLPESEYKKALISLAYLSVDRTY